MPNVIITPQIVAREIIAALVQNMVTATLVHRDFSAEFAASVGDTITIRKPSTFTAGVYNGSTVTPQNLNEGSVEVKLDTIADVSVPVTAKEMTLNIVDFRMQVSSPVATAFAQFLDKLILSRYVDFPYYVDVSGTPSIADLANVNKVLNTNLAPMDQRSLVMDPDTQAAYITLPAIINAEKSGSTDALRLASMGRIMGSDTYMDQFVQRHTAGDLAATATLTADSGATTGTLAIGGNAKSIKLGDIFTIANIAGQYVCTELETTAADGTGTLKFYPALPSAAAGAVITVHATHTANMALHRNAIALVSRPLNKPMSNQRSEVIDYKGLSIRVVYDYDMQTKSDLISFDMLLGVKTINRELGCRLCKA